MFVGFEPHHVGWAVGDIGAATNLFAGLGYVPEPSLPDCKDENFQVHLRFMQHPQKNNLIELISPSGPNSSVGALLKRSGAGPYHLGFRVADMEAAGKQLLQSGFLAVSQLQPAPGLGGRLIRFWHAPAVGLIELILWP
jgi:hypothetical protein